MSETAGGPGVAGRPPRRWGPITGLPGRLDPESVGFRQAPFTLIFILATLFIALLPGSDHPGWLVLSGAVVVGIQLVASLGRWRHWPRWCHSLLPLGQMASLVGLDYATHANPWFITFMLFLPVVSLALQPGRAGVVLGTAGTAVITGIAAATPSGPVPEGPTSGLGVIVVTLCALLVGLSVHVVTQRLQDRTDALLTLQREQSATLRTLAASRDEQADLAGRLEASRNLLLSMIDAATESLVLATDLDGRILLAAPGAERMLGYPREELLGTAVTELVEPAELRQAVADRHWEPTPDSLLRVLVGEAESGTPQRGEWTLRGPGARAVPVELMVTRRPWLDGQAAHGYLFLGADQSERRESERLQDEFVGLASHELRTPLASILGYVELMRSDEDSLTPEHQRYLEVVDRNAHRLLRLVNDLLLSVQIVAGTFTLVRKRADAAEIVRDAVSLLEPTAAAAGVRVRLESPTTAPLMTDPERLGQVVENLLTNAIKFAGAGSVEVSLAAGDADRGGIRLRVADDGPGMPAADVTKVTGRFYRAANARQQRVRGLGLGLSIVDAIVTAHGGTLTLASGPGEGTQITVELPDLTPPKPGAGPPTDPGSSASTG